MTSDSTRRIYEVPTSYEIIVLGKLDKTWVGWFSNLTLTTDCYDTNEPVTILRGLVIDQAELHSILGKINDLGLPLLAVKWIDLSVSRSKDSGYGCGPA